MINVLFRHYSALYVQVPVLTFITDWYRGTFQTQRNSDCSGRALLY